MSKWGIAACMLGVGACLLANDIVYLRGHVQMQDGSAPGKSVVIQLSCKGADPVRLTTAGKKGDFNLKVERDDFNHIARSLPANATDMSNATSYSGPCAVKASLAGYDSTAINLADFTIPQDLHLPNLVLKAK